MPNNKREGQNQNGGSAQGAKDQAQDVAGQVQQRVGEVGDRLRDGYGAARETAAHGYRQAEGMVARNPAPSVLVGFGVGFGLGLVLCSMFTREETWGEKYLPESLQDAPDKYKSLVSSLHHDAPEKYKHLVASLKSLPKAVHDYLPHSVAKHLG